jgi:hypothetical protein
MIREANKKNNTLIVLTITLISLITVTSVLTSSFLQSSFGANTDTVNRQVPKQSSLPISLVVDTEGTNNLSATNLIQNATTTPLITKSILSNTLKFNSFSYGGYSVQRPNMTQPYFSFSDNIHQDQTTGSDVILPINATDSSETNGFNESNMTGAISLENSNFTTYTYGGYSVQQPDLAQFNFSFPDNTNQGQLAGSDAFAMNTFAIQKMDFDAEFITPKISALGFDEMVIFAASNTMTYQGTEFGIRMDLKDGFVYGYIQEPNGNNGNVDFQMLKLAPNDGIIHHYTLINHGSGISFFIDGIDHGYLNFPSNTDYSNLTFYVLAVVHRFTDYWDSKGDNMVVGNFSFNQQ